MAEKSRDNQPEEAINPEYVEEAAAVVEYIDSATDEAGEKEKKDPVEKQKWFVRARKWVTRAGIDTGRIVGVGVIKFCWDLLKVMKNAVIDKMSFQKGYEAGKSATSTQIDKDKK